MNEQGKNIGKRQVLLPPNLKYRIDVPHYRTEIGATPEKVVIATALVVGLCIISFCIIIGPSLLSKIANP